MLPFVESRRLTNNERKMQIKATTEAALTTGCKDFGKMPANGNFLWRGK